MKLGFYCLLLLLLRLTACQTDGDVTTDAAASTDPDQGRFNQIWAALRSPDWQFVFAGKTEQDRNQLREFLYNIAREAPMRKRIRVLNRDSVTNLELGALPTVFFGNEFAADQAKMGSLGFSGASFRNFSIDQPGDLLRLFFVPNLWAEPDSNRLMHVIYGPSVPEMRTVLTEEYGNNWRRFFRPDYDYEVDKNYVPRLKGNFASDSWDWDPAGEIHFAADMEPVYADSNVQIFAPDGAPATEILTAARIAIEQSRAKHAAIFGLSDTPPTKVMVYPSEERIGMRNKDMNPVQYLPETNSIHLVASQLQPVPKGPDLDYAMIRTFRNTLGELPAGMEALDFIDRGLAVRANPDRLALYLNQAVALANHGRLLDEADLIQLYMRSQRSSFLYDISAAAWVEAHLQENGTIGKAIQDLYSEAASGATVKKHMTALKDYLKEGGSNDWKQMFVGKALATPTPIAAPPNYVNGMTFAHEGYRIRDGYGGGTVRHSLDSLSSLHVNALAIVPYSYLENPRKPGQIPVASSAGGENDHAVSYSIRQAHQRNWAVMLKPQIWLGGGSWPGDIQFDTEADWDQFFDRYTEWITHYALLAQREGAASLCIGTEMVRTTLDKPDEWRRIIQLIRSVYGGKLTYAANWGEEFENLTFWDDLDVIGLNSYYPLSENQDPTDAELSAGAEQWVQKAEQIAQQFDRKWWLTEVGYRSVHRAWLNPHAEAGERRQSQECQDRCFIAMLNAADGAERLTGLYVWKWPSYLGYGRRRRSPGTGFTPGGKPAAAALRHFYERH